MAESLLNTEAPVKNPEYSLCELDAEPPTACCILFVCTRSGCNTGTLKPLGKDRCVARTWGAAG